MFGQSLEIEVEEVSISLEEWETLMAIASKKELSSNLADAEKRLNQKPLPGNLSDYINEQQVSSIKKLQGFGWGLYFIRRSNPDDIMTVMCLPNTQETAVIETDGTVN